MTETNTRQIAKFIESKHYKKAIKASDAILKKTPNHGETLCMKGLTLSYLDKKEEAYDLVRKGLKNDLKSHVCWHVFGLLYRQDREYQEAMKCYRFALKIDQDNLQILRDLSLLQIHRRDLAGFCDTRKKILHLKPNNKINWIGYAIAEHLMQNFDTAQLVLEKYIVQFDLERDIGLKFEQYDRSEFYMYLGTILQKAGKELEAIDVLEKNELNVVDTLGSLELKANCYLVLGNKEEDKEKKTEYLSKAAKHYEDLLGYNSENHGYILATIACDLRFQEFWNYDAGKGSFPTSMHREGSPVYGWLSDVGSKRAVINNNVIKRRNQTFVPARPLTEEEEKLLVEKFDEMIEKYPRNDSLPRIILFFLNAGTIFRQRIDAYLKPRIRKGVPSLFRMISGLYFDDGKVQEIEKLILSYLENLKGDTETFEGNAEADMEPPSSLLFILLLAAQHFDRKGDHEKAVMYIQEAVDHTPTMVELYSIYGRILKHAGNLTDSREKYEMARSLDLADRFLNCEAVKSHLRINDVQRGDEVVLLFSKETENSTSANLHDMQCMWYELNVGRAFTRLGQHGKALKKYLKTIEHFADMSEDEFDFHNYCLRKMTLRTYLRMLQIQDKLHSHKFYRRAAKEVIRIYLGLYDRKQRGEAVSLEEQKEQMTAAERKKMKLKEKKNKKKEEAKEAATNKGGVPGKKVDHDPDGEKLLEADFMVEMIKLVDNLCLHSSHCPQTHALSFEVDFRNKKALLCLRALRRLYKLGNNNRHYYKLIPLTARFFLQFDFSECSEMIQQLIVEEGAILVTDQKLKTIDELKKAAEAFRTEVETNQKKNAKDLFLIQTLGNLRCLMDKKPTALAKEWLTVAKQTMGSVKDFVKGYALFKELELGEAYRVKAHEIFPLADAFKEVKEE